MGAFEEEEREDVSSEDPLRRPSRGLKPPNTGQQDPESTVLLHSFDTSALGPIVLEEWDLRLTIPRSIGSTADFKETRNIEAIPTNTAFRSWNILAEQKHNRDEFQEWSL